MTESPRRPRTTHHGEVLRTEQLSPHLVRVVLGGRGLASFDTGGYTDHYVKLLFANPSAPDVDLSDVAALRESLPRDHWPVTRTYTVRAWDRTSLELTLDFVLHGDEGLAGPWAAAAQPGDRLWFNGPGGGYAPDPEADWHLLAGDESALPAIAAALEGMPPAARVIAFIEVGDESEVQKLETPGDATIAWLYRGTRPVGASLVDAVRGLEFPPGRVHAFVHGEADEIRDLRRHLLADRALARADMSCSPYWRRTMTDEAWRQIKRDYVAAMDADVA